MRATLAAIVFAGLSVAAERPDVVLFDFESGTWKGWTYEGPQDKPAFGAAPFDAAKIVPTYRSDRDFVGWQGKYMVAIGDTRHGRISSGKLISDEFTVSRRYLTFRLGAEAHPAVRVALEVEGREVRSAWGNNSYDMRLRGWDVGALAGRAARIVVHAESKDDMLLRLDHFVLSDTAPPEAGTFDESEQESDLLRLGEMRLMVAAPADHHFAYSTVVKSPNGGWLMYASLVAHANRYKPGEQKQIALATAPRLTGPWTYQGVVLEASAEHGEDYAWEPFALAHEGKIWLFYVGSGTPWKGWDKNNNWRVKDFGKDSTQGPHGIHVAVSKDGRTFERPRKGALFTDMPFAFTPFVMQVKNEWVMYYGGAEPAMVMGQHAILARKSRNLLDWSERTVVMKDMTDTTPWPEHAFFHDPFVCERGGSFYLLAGPINNANQSRFHYRRLYRSSDPLRFDMRSDYKGVFAEGGPKMLTGEDGKAYLTHTGRYAGGVWLAPVRWREPSKPEWEKRRIVKSTLLDKIKGGWAGQMIGVAYAAPTEFKALGVTYEKPIAWKPEMVSEALTQDDLYVDMTLAEVMDREGIDAPRESFAKAMAESKYMLWHANAVARRNLQRGVPADRAGHPENNPHANDIDFQIESDFIGLMTPGLPQAAWKYSERIGRLMGYGDGLYGGVFVSALYGAAYFEDNPRKAVEAAVRSLPPQSRYAKLIRSVLDLHVKYPNDWREAWRVLTKTWDQGDLCPKGALVPYNIDAALNGGYVVLGLLYGDRDFSKTVEVATRAGQDSDCNAATAAGVLGVMLGYRQIPDEWKGGIAGLGDRTFQHTNYSFQRIVDSTYERTLKAVRAHGGEVFNGIDVEIPMQAPPDVPFEEWRPGVPGREYRTGDAAWKWTGTWKQLPSGAKSASEAGAQAELAFEGTGVILAGPYQKDGGPVTVWVDGVKRTINTKAAERTSDQGLLTVTGLKAGRHTLRLQLVSGTIEVLRAVSIGEGPGRRP